MSNIGTVEVGDKVIHVGSGSIGRIREIDDVNHVRIEWLNNTANWYTMEEVLELFQPLHIYNFQKELKEILDEGSIT
jgi:hypothetical protein